MESVNVKVDEIPDKSDDEQKLVFIELDVQKDIEHNSAVEDAQLVDEEDEEQEEVGEPG